MLLTKFLSMLTIFSDKANHILLDVAASVCMVILLLCLMQRSRICSGTISLGWYSMVYLIWSDIQEWTITKFIHPIHFIYCNVDVLLANKRSKQAPISSVQWKSAIHIRECGSTLYVEMAHTAPPTNTNFLLTFLVTRLLQALYEDFPV